MNPKITYAPEWIDKILSGQKTMTIRRTQYPCGVYDVVSEAEPDKVVCRIKIVKVEKLEMCLILDTDPYLIGSWTNETYIEASGFSKPRDFIQYHLKNYAPVKYAHTFQLVKGDDNVS